MKLRSARAGIVCLGILAGVAGGCAQERDPINRVQPSAMEKSFFVGPKLRDASDDPEFRMKMFNVGGSVGQSAYSIGEYSALDRVRWEITENLLIARKAYEITPGADNRGTPKSDWEKHAGDKNLVKSPNGAIVGAFRILSHFDIRRAYNTTTGEELNVIEENTSDRAWYDRSHMRVDWSMNIVDGPNDPTRFYSEELGGRATPVSYTPSDPKAEDAPYAELKDGYLDITNKFTVEPDTVRFSWGEMRKCELNSILNGGASMDCNAQEAVVRLSFARIAPDEDFEPFEDSVAWRDVVGNMGGDGSAAETSFGSLPRQGWDPQYGFTDALTKRFKNVHNLFVKSHQTAACSVDDDADKNGTADQCENATTGYKGRSGSRCDVHVGKCTLPIRDREVKTIGYWLNSEAPTELQDEVDAQGKPISRGTLEDLTHSWNQLLEVSLAYRREVECRRTGDGDRASCHAEFFDGDGSPASKVMVSYGGWLIDKVKPQSVDKGKVVLTTCHNPVRVYDPKETCGDVGAKARLGDQRKNFLVYWPFESRARYGGVAGVTPDPVTGEIRGASATIMGRSASYAAALQRDIIQVALGDLSMNDIMKGVPAERYANMVRAGALAAPGLTTALTKEEIANRSSAIDMTHLRDMTGTGATAMSNLEVARTALEHAKNTRYDERGAMASLAQYDAVVGKLSGSPLEAQVVDSHWMVGALGQNPSASINAQVVAAASPLRGLDPMRVDAMRAFQAAEAGRRGACFHGPTAAGPGSVYLASLAGHFKQKYGSLDPVERGKRIFDDLWKEAVKGIGLHEVGHSLGLRHNFASSYDAPNYNPQYWQLRTAEGSATQACSDPRNGDNDSCMGPRYLDPMTSDEQGIGAESRPGIDYFANTSTMEYQLERFGETVGLGTYDLHSMKALYGRVLETFDDRVIPAGPEQRIFAGKTITQLTERDLVNFAKDEVLSHYTQTARLMKVFDKGRDCRPATDEEKAAASWRVVHGQVCSPAPKDHWAFDEFKSDVIPFWQDVGVKWHAVDRDGKDRTRWPYRYGEQYGSGGYMHTSMMDAGADIYELVHNLNQRFKLSYPWSYFRRQNAEYNMLFLPQSIASQYFMKTRAYHWQVAKLMAEIGEASPVFENDNYFRPMKMAQTELLNVLSSAVLQPEPGDYAESTALSHRSLDRGMRIFDLKDRSESKALFSLDISNGRYISEEFDGERGGSWDYQNYVSRAGFEVEKALAMMQIVDTRPTLFSVSRDGALDERANMVSFRSDLPQAVDRLVGGVLSEDWASIAPAVIDPKNPAVMPTDLTPKALKRSPEEKVLFPNIGYKQQLSMAIFAAVFSRLGSDMTLVEKMRMSLEGDRAPQVPGTRRIEFVDPLTGFRYFANRFGDELVGTRNVDKGIASRVLTTANRLVSEAYQVKKNGDEVVLDASGKPELVLDDAGMPIEASKDAAKELRRYVGLVDALRQITRILGEGPLDN